jgi:hypothetical protein
MIGVVHDDRRMRKTLGERFAASFDHIRRWRCRIDIVETRLVKRYAPCGDAETICPSARAGAHEQFRECQELG